MHSSFGPAGAYHGRFTSVDDSAIDIHDTDEISWAMGSRCDPERDVQIVTNCQSTSLDPVIHPDRRAGGDYTNSRIVVDATRPHHWKDGFPEPIGIGEQLRDELYEKWPGVFGS